MSYEDIIDEYFNDQYTGSTKIMMNSWELDFIRWYRNIEHMDDIDRTMEDVEKVKEEFREKKDSWSVLHTEKNYIRRILGLMEMIDRTIVDREDT